MFRKGFFLFFLLMVSCKCELSLRCPTEAKEMDNWCRNVYPGNGTMVGQSFSNDGFECLCNGLLLIKVTATGDEANRLCTAPSVLEDSPRGRSCTPITGMCPDKCEVNSDFFDGCFFPRTCFDNKDSSINLVYGTLNPSVSSLQKKQLPTHVTKIHMDTEKPQEDSKLVTKDKLSYLSISKQSEVQSPNLKDAPIVNQDVSNVLSCGLCNGDIYTISWNSNGECIQRITSSNLNCDPKILCSGHGCCISAQDASDILCHCYSDEVNGYWDGLSCEKCLSGYDIATECTKAHPAFRNLFDSIGAVSITFIVPHLFVFLFFVGLTLFRKRWRADREYDAIHQIRANLSPVQVALAKTKSSIVPKDIPKRPKMSRGFVNILFNAENSYP